MAVIGNSPNPNDISVFKTVNKQTITGTGDSSYNLSYDVSVPEELEVFVNNVRQEPRIAYNIGSGQITFDEGIDSTDDCYIIFQGSRVGTVEPASNTITTEMMQNAAITSKKLHDSQESLTLSGTLDANVVTGNTIQIPDYADSSSQPNAVTGQIYFNTTDRKMTYYDSDTWYNLKNEAKDEYIDDVLYYQRGGTLTPTIGTNSPSAVSISTSTAPGKPFGQAPSTSWYLIGGSATSNYYDTGITASTVSPNNYTNFTIEFWIYINGTNGSYGHFYWVGGQSNEGVIKYGGPTTSGGGVSYGFYWYTNTTVIASGGSGTAVQGRWYHMVYEKYGSTNSWWQDGVRKAQNTTGWVTQNESTALKLGYSNQGSEYNTHYFDELRITKAARYKGAASIDVQSEPWPTS